MPPTGMKPGPYPASCLTCRRRRKKCDRSRPNCERCLKGGFKCLGYEHDEPSTRAEERPNALITRQRRKVSSIIPPESSRQKASDPVTVGMPKDRQASTDIDMEHDLGPSVLGAALAYWVNGNGPSSSNEEDSSNVNPSEAFDRSWPQDQRQLTTYPQSQTYRTSGAGRAIEKSSGVGFIRIDSIQDTRALYRSIPPSVDARQIMREGYSVHVIQGYQTRRTGSWFMTPPAPVRDYMIARMKGSKRIILALGLGTKLLLAIDEDPRSKTVRRYLGLVDNLEKKVITGSYGNLPVNDVSERLMVQLELAFLKFTMVDSNLGYASLQKARSLFLHLIGADTSLCIERPYGSLVVSCPRTLVSPRHELKQFVLYDTLSSFLLGVPPLVEYDHDGECDSRSHGLEWVHGVPVVLVKVISQVNSWRASTRAAPSDLWEQLEERVLAWKPELIVINSENASIENVARLAIQESWRHAVLIYIYMGICGVSSHDLRVQASVNQIIKLGETVANLTICVQMFTQYLIVGLAARLEKHRVLVREKLLAFKDARVWFFRGPEFAEVLYHLWNGVAEGGAAVRWDDYVRSRRAISPV